MPVIFVYEFLTAGGWRSLTKFESPPESLLQEGRAMVQALIEDFAAIPGIEVLTLRDEADEPAEFRALAARADWTVVIAPEFDQVLQTRARWVGDIGGRLLGPSPEIIVLCAEKQRTCDHLTRANIPTPRGIVLDTQFDVAALEAFQYPLVLKPNDGAGSQNMRLIRFRAELMRGNWRLEEYASGMPASVAFLCGPNGNMPLPPCVQHLADDGSFQYLGGRCPLPPPLAARATSLAAATINTLPNPVGYLGVDLILGADPSGHDDVVIEINPRLTTSYVGLRALSHTNLAAAMLAIATGAQTSLDFNSKTVEFTAAGRTHHS